MKVFDSLYETLPRAELEQLQLERLQALLSRLRRNVRRYREQLEGARIESLDDIGQLPFTGPEDLAHAFPYGLFALPLREVIRLHSMTGPGGKPLVIGHTRNDVVQWGRLTARQLAAAGVTPNDVVQISLGGGVHRGAYGYALGAECLEASVIAEEPIHLDYQLAMLQNYRPTVLITTPSNAREVMRLMEMRRIDPQSLHLRTVLFSRPVDKEAREEFRAGLFAPSQCNFGLEEILDPGLCVECQAGKFHVNEDHFYVEQVNGELVVTTLCREAMPLLRYRTSVECELRREKCPCGRTGVLLKPGKRLDGRLLIGETHVYEGQIAEALAQTPVAWRPFRLEINEGKALVSLEMTEDIFTDTMWPIENLKRDIQAELLARLGIQAQVKFYTRIQP